MLNPLNNEVFLLMKRGILYKVDVHFIHPETFIQIIFFVNISYVKANNFTALFLVTLLRQYTYTYTKKAEIIKNQENLSEQLKD